jgi:hypothetical protein
VIEARKLSFQEVWETSTIFYVDEEFENEIDAKVKTLLKVADDPRISESATIDVDSIESFLSQTGNALDVILKDIQLSEEKFLRIVSLLRKLGRIPGVFESEWGIEAVKSKLHKDTTFAHLLAEVLVDGKRDKELSCYIPRYYLDTLNYREIKGSSRTARMTRYKSALIGTYGAAKGYKIEGKIKARLDVISNQYGISYEQGRSRFIETDIDFAIPTLEDPWVILMSSFQETTSSGQTTKARDMLSAFERVVHSNSRYQENRAFVNFVDGGGWLARKRDLNRLVEHCHYFINLYNLDMLDPIILKHVLTI